MSSVVCWCIALEYYNGCVSVMRIYWGWSEEPAEKSTKRDAPKRRAYKYLIGSFSEQHTEHESTWAIKHMAYVFRRIYPVFVVGGGGRSHHTIEQLFGKLILLLGICSFSLLHVCRGITSMFLFLARSCSGSVMDGWLAGRGASFFYKVLWWFRNKPLSMEIEQGIYNKSSR